MPNLDFTTAISGHTERGIELRGQLLTDLIGEADFVSTLFLSITGRKPQPNEKQLLNAMLVASIDHGINSASTYVPRVAAAAGNPILVCMASTFMGLGPYHGGAITAAMEQLQELDAATGDKEKACVEFVVQKRAHKQRVMGYGHLLHKHHDPRTVQLFKMARAQKIESKFINLAEMLEQAIEQTLKRRLVLNVDGAMAALLLTLGFAPAAGNAIFGLARVAGSIAHILEEQEQRKNSWVRRLDEGQVRYEKDVNTY